MIKQSDYIKIPLVIWILALVTFIIVVILQEAADPSRVEAYYVLLDKITFVGLISLIFVWVISFIQYFRKSVSDVVVKGYMKVSIIAFFIFVVVLLAMGA